MNEADGSDDKRDIRRLQLLPTQAEEEGQQRIGGKMNGPVAVTWKGKSCGRHTANRKETENEQHCCHTKEFHRDSRGNNIAPKLMCGFLLTTGLKQKKTYITVSL